MTELDEIFGPLSSELIGEFGKLISYTRIVSGGYNPETSSSDKTPTQLDIKAIVEDYQLQSSGQQFASGLIEAGDKKLTIARADLPFIPTPGDKVMIDLVGYNVVRVVNTYSGEQVAVYEVQVRT